MIFKDYCKIKHSTKELPWEYLRLNGLFEVTTNLPANVTQFTAEIEEDK